MLDSVCLHVSNFCNLSCAHCWSNSGPKGSRFLHSASIERFLLELVPLGLTRVSISGGEPLLYDGLGSLLDFANAHELEVVVTSNGSQLTRLTELLSRFSIMDAKWLSLRISIDGPQAVSDRIRGDGTYNKAVDSLRMIQESLGATYVNAVIGDEIETDLWESFFQKMASLNVCDIALMTWSPRGRGAVHSEKYRRIQKNVLVLEEVARKSGFTGAIKKWDYLTVDHGYLLVEHDGQVMLPGIEDENDKIFGHFENATTDLVKAFLNINRNVLNYDMNDQKECCNE